MTAESRVGIHAERSAEFVLAVLAVLKAGGAYVPLDPQLARVAVGSPAEGLWRWGVAECAAGVLG